MALRIRRGLDIERQSIIPAEGEPLYCTDTGMLYIGDGSTIGGNLVTGIKSLLDDPTPALSANLDLNSNNIVGMGDINIVGDLTVSGNLNIDAVKADYRGSLFGDDSTLLVNGFDHTVHASIIANDGTKLVNTETGEFNLKNTVLDSFGNVSTKDAADGDGLFYDGSHWVAKPFGSDGTGDPPHGSILQWVSGSGWMAQSFIMSADSSPMMNFDTGEIFLGQSNLESIRNVFIDLNAIKPDEVLVWDGLNWTHKEIDASNLQLQGIDLDSIEGVYVPAPTGDDLFYYDGNNWINKPGTIDILKDVALTGLATNQYLRFDGFNWTNDFVTFNHIDGCVILKDPEEYDIIMHDGYNWTNQTLKLDSLSGVNVDPAPTNPSALIYDNGIWTDKPFSLSSLPDVDVPTTPNDPIILKYDPTTNVWAGANFDLNALTNVEAPAPVHGDVLIWSSTDNAWQANELGLSSLTDVEDAISPFDGDVLVWNSSISSWQPKELRLSELMEVLIDPNTLSPDQILKWTGAAWEAADIELPDEFFTPVIDKNNLQYGDRLGWDGFDWVAFPHSNVQTDIIGDDSSIIIDVSKNNGYFDRINVNAIQSNSLKITSHINERLDLFGPVSSNFQVVTIANDGWATIKCIKQSSVNDLSADTNPFGRLVFGRADTTNGEQATAVLYSSNGYLRLSTSSSGTFTPEETVHLGSVDGELKVGIGTFEPDETLHVAGSGKYDSFVQFGSLSTAERDALTPANGMVIYNSTVDKFQGYAGSTWVDLS